MTTNATAKRTIDWGKRLPDLAVVLLILVALGAGWLLKTGVENRSQAFSGGGVSAQVPAGWLRLNPSGSEVLHAIDRSASGFSTTYLIEALPVAADAQPGQVASLVTLARGKALTAYRVLNQQDVLVQGQKATEIEYVYVESAANLSHAIYPAVVHGLDFIFIQNGKATIVGYRADQAAFDADLGRFYRFLVTVK